MSSNDERARGMRLRAARAERFESAADAARALGVSKDTYAQHENGIRGFKGAAERYAKFFRVNLEWLWTGRGEMRPSKDAPLDADELEFAKAFSRAPVGVQRIIEGILKDAEGLTEEEKRSLGPPDVSYAQEDAAPTGLQDDLPQRPRGLPIDKIGLDQAAVDEALARPSSKRKPKRR